jgi:cell division protease FtsH
LALWVIIGLLLIALFNLFQSPAGKTPNALAFSDFLTEVEAGRIANVTIQGNNCCESIMSASPSSPRTRPCLRC